MHWLRGALVVLSVCVLIASCGGADSKTDSGSNGSQSTNSGTSTGTGNCTPGETQSCFGPDACEGGRVCLEDGSAFGDCVCGSATGGGMGGGMAGPGGSMAGPGGAMAGPGGAGGAMAGPGGAGGMGSGGMGSGGMGSVCDSQQDCVQCATCTQAMLCANEWVACDQACMDATDCLSACEAICAGGVNCFNSCAQNHANSCANRFPAGIANAQALQTCACTACSSDCSQVDVCSALDPFACDFSGFSAVAGEARAYPDLLEVYFTQNSGGGTDLLLVELHYPQGATTMPQTVTLTGDNYNTCANCVRIARTVAGTTTHFLAQSGTLDISANGVVGDMFSFNLTHVTFAEVTINPATKTSTLVPNGQTWCVDSLNFSRPIVPGTGNCTLPPIDPLFSCTPNTAACPQTPCDAVNPQCGCATGAKCAYDAGTSMRGCFPAGMATEGQACMDLLDCATGQCIESNMIGRCYEFCNNDGDCVGPGGKCVVDLMVGETWCSLNCNPLTSTGCIAGTACHALAGNSIFTDCTASGAGTHNQTCMDLSDCAPTFTCADAGTGDRCYQYCLVNNPACPLGRTCVGFVTPLIIGANEYGACI